MWNLALFASARRLLRRDASTSVPAIGILALGLGANLAIFSIAYGVLLRPLAVADQESLVVMWERSEEASVSVWEVSYRDFLDWEAQNASFTQLAATGSVNWSLRLSREDGPIVLPFAAVSGTFFDLVGATPLLGRPLARTDDHSSNPDVAVISHAMWRNHFGADPGLIGRSVQMDVGAGMTAVTVIGVMPPEFDYPRGAAAWLPLAPALRRSSHGAGYDMLEERGLGILYVTGRLRPGVSVAEARADMDAIVDRLTSAGAAGTGRAIVVTPLVDHIFGQTRPALLLMMAAAALVLFLACANVVGLLLARLSANRRELAIQMALGAPRSYLFRQALAESVLLVGVGLIAASILAAWTIPVLVALAPETVPRLGDVTFRSPAIAGFALTAGGLLCLGCGIVPLTILLKRFRLDLAGPDGLSSRTTLGVRNGLLVVQTALAVVLLVTATLTVRSFHAIQRVNVGFDPEGLLTVDVLAPEGKYPKSEVNARFYREAIDRIRNLPGVSGVAGVHLRPFEFGPIGSSVSVVIEGQSPRDRTAWRSNPALNAEAISPDYFSLMKIPLLHGRAFSEADTAASPPVAIVSLAAARRLWPGQDPVGKRLLASYDNPDGEWRAVVGVVGNVRYRGLNEETLDLYKPYLQSEDAVRHVIVQTSQSSSTLAGALRSEIRSIEPQAVVDSIRPLREVVDRQLAPWGFTALLFSLLGALALSVAIVGLYALLAHHVALRTREIGIRMALGAQPRQIIGHLTVRAMGVMIAGVLVGVIAALLSGRSLEALLFGVTATDAATYGFVCMILLAASVVAAYRPIRRATAVDPILALRQE